MGLCGLCYDQNEQVLYLVMLTTLRHTTRIINGQLKINIYTFIIFKDFVNNQSLNTINLT